MGHGIQTYNLDLKSIQLRQNGYRTAEAVERTWQLAESKDRVSAAGKAEDNCGRHSNDHVIGR